MKGNKMSKWAKICNAFFEFVMGATIILYFVMLLMIAWIIEAHHRRIDVEQEATIEMIPQ